MNGEGEVDPEEEISNAEQFLEILSKRFNPANQEKESEQPI